MFANKNNPHDFKSFYFKLSIFYISIYFSNFYPDYEESI